jgi:RNA polymerase sigma-70 factor (ECF subfamily)
MEAMATTPEQAFAAHYDEIFRYLYRRVGDEADELAAETFAVAFRTWHRFDAERPVAPWLYGIATNLLRRRRRDEVRQLRAYARTGVDPVVSAIDDEALGHADGDLARRSLAAALAELRPQERDVLLLHAWAELSDEEIASAVGVPVGTVKSRLSRARQRVRNRLGPIGEEVAR